ncbi:hypothetical protein [Neoroseomonas soli]|uniref:Uncharacterized protein n=1 Tax=Neoroseomonas soli TaxID=1081025 RepID=A0A9X9X099_9PROT|nr:hypothetical protein [Neoroseomonas soli]MBR0672828.1 hypothetical protein [Neoroseomonas soli]
MTNLAEAVAVSGAERERVLQSFVRGAGPGTYTPTRRVLRRLYGSHGAEDGAYSPLIEHLPPEPWDKIEPDLRADCQPDHEAANLEVARLLYDHARTAGYVATHFDAPNLRTGRSIVPIPMNMFLALGDRLIFQFPHLRRSPLTANQEDVMATIIAMTCIMGDFEPADVEIVSFPPEAARAKGKREGSSAARPPRITRLTTIDRKRWIPRTKLQPEIDDVYAILHKLASE